MFKYAGITRIGLSALAESIKNGGLEFTNAEYYDGIIEEVTENIRNEEKLKEAIEKLTLPQISNFDGKKCSLAVQNIFKESNILKVVSRIIPESFDEGFRARAGALFAKSPVNGAKILFAYFVATEESAAYIDPNAAKMGGDYFISSFNFKNLDTYNIKYTFCENYSLPTIDLEEINDEEGNEEGCNIKINYGLKKYVEATEDEEAHYEPIEKSFVVKHGEKGDVGPEGPMFTLSERYKTTEEMYADKENVEIGKHVIIENYDKITYEISEENGNIYQRIEEEPGYRFVVKILGAKGQKGQDSEGKDLFDSIYPVGSIYTSINPKLPKEFSKDGRVWKTLPSGYMLQQAFDEDLEGSTDDFNKLTIDEYSEDGTLKKIEEGIPDIFGEMLYISKEWGSDGIGNGAFSKEASSNTVRVRTGNSESDVNVGSAKFYAHNGEYELTGENNDVLRFPYRDELENEGIERKYGVYKPGYKHVQPNAIRVNMWLRIK